MKVSIVTLGCKANQYDSSAIEDALISRGHAIANFPSIADAYVINTCTVTNKTDSESYKTARRARRLSPSATIILTGCLAETRGKEALVCTEVDYVLGNPEKALVIEYLERGRPITPEVMVEGHSRPRAFSMRARGASGRARANLKVQDGCRKACSYCIIPKARGASVSLPLHEVDEEMDVLVGAGYKEIVLTGIHLGAYGHDLVPEKSFKDLLRLIESRDYPCNFRLSSIDPDELDAEAIELIATSRRICNHVHLPLQSGDADVLKLMRRDHTPEDFAQKVESLHKSVAGVSIGTDVIVGFPGEGEKEFENTVSLIEALPLAYLHVFPYSMRPGTRAASMKGAVDAGEVERRAMVLRAIDLNKRREFNKIFIGKSAGVIVERSRDRATGLLKGKTSNYISVYFEGDDSLKGNCALVILTEQYKDGLISRKGALPEKAPRMAY